MFFGNISQIDKKIYPDVIFTTLNYLKGINIDSLEVGRYDIDGDKIFYQVIEMETKQKHESLPESHRRYIDIQYLHSGEEITGVCVNKGNFPIAKEYDETKDIMFYQTVDDETDLVLKPGNFAVFFPSDIHRPTCMYKEKRQVKKIVIKIDVNLL